MSYLDANDSGAVPLPGQRLLAARVAGAHLVRPEPGRRLSRPDPAQCPGTTSAGLSPHTDAGSLERWLLPAYHQVFRHVFGGNPGAYDPGDGAYRTEVEEYRSTVMCSVFRTFQGWTALSSMARTEGVLNVLPIPHAMVYLLLRTLQDDVADDDLCGAANGQSLPVDEAFHAVLLPGMSPMPDVEPGDTVWWHPDAVHSADPVTDQQGWGNVMYIPAAPYCPKNAAYAERCGQAFRGVRLLRSERRVRERAVPVVRMVPTVRAGAIRAIPVTTSMWQRGGWNNVAVTSTWLGAATGAGAAAPVWGRMGAR